MRKQNLLILLLLCLMAGTLYANPHKGINNMTPCDTPRVNPDSLLLQYLSHRPLSATGGVPPYTYTFSPSPSLTELISMPDTNITFTITVTGANGCSSIYHATYDALKNISSGSCTTLFMSEYIQDTVHNDDAIELYNPTSSSVNLSSYYLMGTTNGSLYAAPFFISLHGTIAAHSTFLIANTHADTFLTHRAGMLSDSLTFGGLDIVALAQITITVPNVTFSFLDEIGTISPLPTDSGWAVGSGSTKNHTLTRQTSVTQGSTNWSTCKTEWNIYSRGTFSYIGTYNNVCDPADAILYLSLANDSVQCGDPSYYHFDVLIQADSPKILADVAFTLDYPSGISAGTTVTQGADFPPDPTEADYSLSTTESSNSITIQLNAINHAYQQTVVDTVPKILAHVSMKIANACQSGTIKFNPSIFLCHYVEEDSTFVRHDSTIVDSLTNPNYHCAYQCDPYPCNPYCCDIGDTDDYGNCIDTCWATCYNTCYDTCYDTIRVVHHYNVYSYTDYSTYPYSNVIYSDTIPLQTCPPVIEPLDRVNAGTNSQSIPSNSSVLTIKGSNFGNEKGFIIVPNANKGGSGTNISIDSVDILSWSNNRITVKMPSVMFGVQDTMTPGSGLLTVINTCNSVGGQNLTINYNIINEALSSEKLRYNTAMSNDSNSIIFHCDTSISNYPRIQADVVQAIETWNCYTGINWKMGSDTTLETHAQDGVSVIYFTNSLPPNIGMETFIYADYGCNDLGDSMAYVHEADIIINRVPYPGYIWNYDVSNNTFTGLHYYFYDLLLHELGHAHLLNHIDDYNSVMYWLGNPNARRNLLTGDYPGPQTLYGGFDVVNTSAANTPSCSYRELTPSTRNCTDPTLAVGTVSQNQYNLSLYPNPVGNQNLTISYEITKDSYVQFKVIDYTGREIILLNNEHKLPGAYKEQINTTGFASGIYLFIANIDGNIENIKFIKL